MKFSYLKQKLLLLGGYFFVVAVFWWLKLPCLIQYFFHIPCPGCGMTRAVLAALRLDFAAAFQLHPMFWSLPILGVYLLVDGGIFKSRKANTALLLALGTGFLAAWFIKLL